MNRYHPAFQFCERCEVLIIAGHHHSSMGCEEVEHRRPATNKEVFLAWLQADDERRKELELASRPTKVGRCSSYSLDVHGLPYRMVLTVTRGWLEANMGFADGCLWIPIEEN